MVILPLWTKEVELSQRALDPLGLSRISEYITNRLLPGITSLTTKGRNYSFYCWAINQVNGEFNPSLSQFYKKIAMLESAYVIGGLMDAQENFPGANGPIGNDKATRKINLADNGIIDINFSILSNPGGGYKQYYRNAMSLLGLTRNLNNRDILTPEGEILAKLFEQNISDTTYYKKYISIDKVPLAVLKEYGEKGGYLRLIETEDEKDKLCAILFSDNQNVSEIPYSRRSTFLFVLKLYHLFSSKKYLLTDNDYKNILYYGKTSINNNLIEFRVQDDILIHWRFFQFHEFFTFAIESIFDVFLRHLMKSTNGSTVNLFLEENNSFINTMEEMSFINLETASVGDVLNILLSVSGISSELNYESSRIFDEKTDLDSPYSEAMLCRLINENWDEGPRVIGLCMSLLMVLLARYLHYIEKYDESILWIKFKLLEEWSLDTLYRDIASKIAEMNLKDLFEYLVRTIIQQHDLIAYEKLYLGHDTFRFQPNGDKLFFKKNYTYTRRGDRFRTIKNLFEDLGLIFPSEGIYEISEFGKTILRRFNNE